MGLQSVPAAEPEDVLANLKNLFLASLNHEIRTPLTGILGMTDLLLETPLDEEQKEYVATVHRCAGELLALFNKTLEFSDLSSGRIVLTQQEFHLPETIRGAVSAHSPAARAKGLKLACRLVPGLPEVAIGDAVRLRQALSHIVDNAVKFTEQGRVEVLAAGSAEDGKFRLSLKVSDTGIGIPADKQVAIFESFRQLDGGLARAYAGLGLGLPLAQKLVLLMGGEIGVESEPGRGSTFSVNIPLRLAGEHPPAGGPSAEAGKIRVLLVDDNEVAQRVVTHILTRADIVTHCASSGREAIESASAQSYDLILMDLQMPEMDGFESAAKIRALPGWASIPIVALTANATEEYRRLCLSRGMQGFVCKPVQAEELLDALSNLLY